MVYNDQNFQKSETPENQMLEKFKLQIELTKTNV